MLTLIIAIFVYCVLLISLVFFMLETLPAVYGHIMIKLRYKTKLKITGYGLESLLPKTQLFIHLFNLIVLFIVCFFIYVQFELSALEMHLKYCI